VALETRCVGLAIQRGEPAGWSEGIAGQQVMERNLRQEKALRPDSDQPWPGSRGPGAPPGNTNRLVHGMKSRRYGLVLSRLADRHHQLGRDIQTVRQAVEALVRERQGKVPLLAVARIQTVCRLETACRIVERSLRDRHAATGEEAALAWERIVRWSAWRDGILTQLLADGGPAAGGIDWDSIMAGRVQARRPAADLSDPHPGSESEGVGVPSGGGAPSFASCRPGQATRAEWEAARQVLNARPDAPGHSSSPAASVEGAGTPAGGPAAGYEPSGDGGCPSSVASISRPGIDSPGPAAGAKPQTQETSC